MATDLTVKHIFRRHDFLAEARGCRINSDDTGLPVVGQMVDLIAEAPRSVLQRPGRLWVGF